MPSQGVYDEVVRRHHSAVAVQPQVGVGEHRRRRGQVAVEPVQPADQRGGLVEQASIGGDEGSIGEASLTLIRILAELRRADVQLDREGRSTPVYGVLRTQLNLVRDSLVGRAGGSREVMSTSHWI